MRCSCPGHTSCREGRSCYHVVGYAILHRTARNLDEQLQEAMPADPAPPPEPKASGVSGPESASTSAPGASAAAATPIWLQPEPKPDVGRRVSFDHTAANYDYEWHGSAAKDPLLATFDSSAVDAADLIEGEGCHVLALMNGQQTQHMARFVVERSRELDRLKFLCYTFDLDELLQSMIRAHRRGVYIVFGTDEARTKSNEHQCRAVLTLVQCGIECHALTGKCITEEYRAAGRGDVYPGIGICHVKRVRMGPYLILGSVNWTTSSRCNIEQGTLLKLNRAEERREYEREKVWFRNGKVLTEPLLRSWLITLEEKPRGRSASRSRARSAGAFEC